jgi:HEAT repeat protein
MTTACRDGNLWDLRRLARFASHAVVLAMVLIWSVTFGTARLIGSGVHAIGDAAVLAHPGDRIPALLAYVESPKHTLRERNRAVWALGQLADARALPVLEKYLTGGDCEHGRLLCQHELRKAIRLCHGGTNISTRFWR